jgi:hypothetical protein
LLAYTGTELLRGADDICSITSSRARERVWLRFLSRFEGLLVRRRVSYRYIVSTKRFVGLFVGDAWGGLVVGQGRHVITVSEEGKAWLFPVCADDHMADRWARSLPRRTRVFRGRVHIAHGWRLWAHPIRMRCFVPTSSPCGPIEMTCALTSGISLTG